MLLNWPGVNMAYLAPCACFSAAQSMTVQPTSSSMRLLTALRQVGHAELDGARLVAQREAAHPVRVVRPRVRDDEHAGVPLAAIRRVHDLSDGQVGR